MAKSRLPERMIETILRTHNIVYERTSSGKHIKFSLFYKEQKKTIVVPCSISDHRGVLNLYADARRVIKGLGMEFIEDKSVLKS